MWRFECLLVQVLFMECVLWTRQQPRPLGRRYRGELAHTCERHSCHGIRVATSTSSYQCAERRESNMQCHSSASSHPAHTTCHTQGETVSSKGLQQWVQATREEEEGEPQCI